MTPRISGTSPCASIHDVVKGWAWARTGNREETSKRTDSGVWCCVEDILAKVSPCLKYTQIVFVAMSASSLETYKAIIA